MTKFSHADDDRDEPRRDKGGGNTALVVQVVVGAVVGLCGVGGVEAILFAWREAPIPPQPEAIQESPAAAEAKPAPMAREEFRKAVVGKTPAEVIAAVGEPDGTQDYGGGDQNWDYDRRTVDPVTGKTDHTTQVIFDRGKADHVYFKRPLLRGDPGPDQSP